MEVEGFVVLLLVATEHCLYFIVYMNILLC